MGALLNEFALFPETCPIFTFINGVTMDELQAGPVTPQRQFF